MENLKVIGVGMHVRLFLMDIIDLCCGEHAASSAKWMKVSVMGIIVSIRAFAEKCIYTVDDGTALLDIAIKNKDFSSELEKLKASLNIGVINDADTRESIQSLERKLEVYHQRTQDTYSRGDMLIAYGFISIFNNKPRLEVTQHYKVEDPDLESLWILEQLRLYKDVYLKK